jgi:hypothetical protein
MTGVMSKDLRIARLSAKRQRTSVACARCKISKIKCSDFRPCKKCVNANSECYEIQESNRVLPRLVRSVKRTEKRNQKSHDHTLHSTTSTLEHTQDWSENPAAAAARSLASLSGVHIRASPSNFQETPSSFSVNHRCIFDLASISQHGYPDLDSWSSLPVGQLSMLPAPTSTPKQLRDNMPTLMKPISCPATTQLALPLLSRMLLPSSLPLPVDVFGSFRSGAGDLPHQSLPVLPPLASLLPSSTVHHLFPFSFPVSSAIAKC